MLDKELGAKKNGKDEMEILEEFIFGDFSENDYDEDDGLILRGCEGARFA